MSVNLLQKSPVNFQNLAKGTPTQHLKNWGLAALCSLPYLFLLNKSPKLSHTFFVVTQTALSIKIIKSGSTTILSIVKEDKTFLQKGKKIIKQTGSSAYHLSTLNKITVIYLLAAATLSNVRNFPLLKQAILSKKWIDIPFKLSPVLFSLGFTVPIVKIAYKTSSFIDGCLFASQNSKELIQVAKEALQKQLFKLSGYEGILERTEGKTKEERKQALIDAHKKFFKNPDQWSKGIPFITSDTNIKTVSKEIFTNPFWFSKVENLEKICDLLGEDVSARILFSVLKSPLARKYVLDPIFVKKLKNNQKLKPVLKKSTQLFQNHLNNTCKKLKLFGKTLQNKKALKTQIDNYNEYLTIDDIEIGESGIKVEDLKKLLVKEKNKLGKRIETLNNIAKKLKTADDSKLLQFVMSKSIPSRQALIQQRPLTKEKIKNHIEAEQLKIVAEAKKINENIQHLNNSNVELIKKPSQTLFSIQEKDLLLNELKELKGLISDHDINYPLKDQINDSEWINKIEKQVIKYSESDVLETPVMRFLNSQGFRMHDFERLCTRFKISGSLTGETRYKAIVEHFKTIGISTEQDLLKKIFKLSKKPSNNELEQAAIKLRDQDKIFDLSETKRLQKAHPSETIKECIMQHCKIAYEKSQRTVVENTAVKVAKAARVGLFFVYRSALYASSIASRPYATAAGMLLGALFSGTRRPSYHIGRESVETSESTSVLARSLFITQFVHQALNCFGPFGNVYSGYQMTQYIVNTIR